MTKARSTMTKAPWITEEHILDYAARRAAVPEELRRAFVRFADDMCDLGEEHNVPPKTMAALAAGLISLLCLSEVDGQIHNDAAIGDFIEYCHRVMHLAVAEARINGGWTPPA